MTEVDRDYLDGWEFQARMMTWGDGRTLMRGAIAMAVITPGLKTMNPFDPFGAGRCDAALVAFGLDA